MYEFIPKEEFSKQFSKISNKSKYKIKKVIKNICEKENYFLCGLLRNYESIEYNQYFVIICDNKTTSCIGVLNKRRNLID